MRHFDTVFAKICRICGKKCRKFKGFHRKILDFVEFHSHDLDLLAEFALILKSA